MFHVEPPYYIFDYIIFFFSRQGILKDFVEKIRRQDTWEWKTKYDDQMADDLAQYFNAVGKEKFIDSMLTKIKENPEKKFFFTEDEQEIIMEYKQHIQDVCQKCYETMKFVGKGNVIFGVGNIPYKYRNEMAEYIRNNNIEIDALALPNYETMACSFRSISEDMDVNEFAMMFGGGGHKGASSAPISKELCEALKLSLPQELINDEPNC